MLRRVDPRNPAADLQRMQALDEARGIPGVAPYYQRMLQEGWLTRNNEVRYLYERAGVLAGFVGLVPITPEAYDSFLSGERFPVFDFALHDLVPSGALAAARRHGVHIWLESFAYQDAAAKTALGEFVYLYLSETNLKGLLVATSTPSEEDDCRWMGLHEVREAGECPTGVRKLWYADAGMVAPTEDRPFGEPTPARALFIQIRRRFGGPRLLGLSTTERRVAELYYLDGYREASIGALLGIKMSTVHTHLDRIRTKADKVIGSRDSRPIVAWLNQHLNEIVQDSDSSGGPGSPKRSPGAEGMLDRASAPQE